jgi:FolB domain-containing protein
MPAKHKFSRDKIFIEELRLKCNCGLDAFGRKKPQPVDLSVTLGTTIARAAAEDRVELSVDYSDFVKRLGKLEDERYDEARDLLDRVVELGLEEKHVGSVNVVAKLEKGLLDVRQVVWEAQAFFDGVVKRKLTCHVRGLEVPIIIGIKENEHERTQKQPVEVDLTWSEDGSDISFFAVKEVVNLLRAVQPAQKLSDLENCRHILRVTRVSRNVNRRQRTLPHFQNR